MGSAEESSLPVVANAEGDNVDKADGGIAGIVADPPLPVPLNPPPFALCTLVALLALAALLAEPTPWLWGTLLTLVGPRPDPPDLSPGSSRNDIKSLKSRKITIKISCLIELGGFFKYNYIGTLN